MGYIEFSIRGFRQNATLAAINPEKGSSGKVELYVQHTLTRMGPVGRCFLRFKADVDIAIPLVAIISKPTAFRFPHAAA